MLHMKFQKKMLMRLNLHNPGITVAIATGRAFYEANTPVAETDLSVPYICLNGAEVRDESFNIMNTSNLNHELVERIKSILDKDDVYYQIYTNRGFIQKILLKI